MRPFESYLQDLPHAAAAAPELEAFVLLDVVKRRPGMQKRLLAAAALGVFGRDLEPDRSMLVYIDSLEATKDVYRHDFGYHLTPGGERRLVQLKNNLRGPLMRAL